MNTALARLIGLPGPEVESESGREFSEGNSKSMQRASYKLKQRLRRCAVLFLLLPGCC